MIKAIIFDLYGTLIRLDRDTRPYLRFARGLDDNNARHVARQSLVITTQGIADLANQLGGISADGLTEYDADLSRDIQSSRVFDDAIEVLAQLRASGLTLGLISNVASPYKEPFYRHHLDQYFDAVSFSCDAGVSKPDPEIYKRMAARLEIGLGEALMVGDSPRSDYEGPKSVGMEALLLRRNGERAGVSTIVGLGELLTEIKRQY